MKQGTARSRERHDIEQQIIRLNTLRQAARNPPMPDGTTAAKLYGINYQTYKKITAKTGARRITPRDALIIANYHKVEVAWVLFGIGSPEAQYSVPLTGTMMAGVGVVAFGSPRVTDGIICPAGGCFAIEIGEDNYPLFHKGDLAFFADMSRPISHLLGELCACEIGGEIQVRVLEVGSGPGLHTLHSVFGTPPIRDVVVSRAGKFLGLRRAPD